MGDKTAIIIGAGPAGLTAAYELLEKTDIMPVIYEMTGHIGGISRTEKYKGNRIDIGGHRFFSKHDQIMRWWFNILPLQGAPSKDDILLGRPISFSQEPGAPDPQKVDRVMLIRQRLSRILFLQKFYDYPVSLNWRMVFNLGIPRIIRIGLSYIRAKIFPIKDEKSLEDFFINRFGKKLYEMFFKDYTEKFWGIPCKNISPEWGAQRIKGLSVFRAIAHAVKKIFSNDTSIEQKNVETSLIEQFVYPKFGPGQLWEEVACIIENKGGQILLNHEVRNIKYNGNRVHEIEVIDNERGMASVVKGDYFISTMPVRSLIASLGSEVPEDVKDVAKGLSYRDFITVGLLLKKLKLKNGTKIRTINNIIPDSWIYIQDSRVNVGRLQVFNNWNPYMVKDENTVWIGLEIACNETDELWSKTDNELVELVIEELVFLNIINSDDLIDSVVIKQPKAYPVYFGTYSRFDVVRRFTDTLENMYLIGRNGMHRYNNMDHSMLTAMNAVGNISAGISSKDDIWDVNVEDDYHEIK